MKSSRKAMVGKRKKGRADEMPAVRKTAIQQTAVIQVENLSIYREKNKILQDLCWEVQAGEHWVILGANGSGKTSLLSALAGYLMPSQGEIRVMGAVYGKTDWREMRKQIGLVSASLGKMVEPEETGLGIVASGREAVVNSWKLSPSDLRRALKILRQIEASHLAHREWRVLSQGERQRLMIGRALMAAPPLLILDEPCAGLDPVAREYFLRFVDSLARQRSGPALVFVTHHVEEIMPSFTHLLLLREGEVVAQGPLAETLQSILLEKTFGAPITLVKAQQRYTLKIEGSNFIQD